MKALVVIEVSAGVLSSDGLGIVSRLAELGGEVEALVFGAGDEPELEPAARAGAAKVSLCTHAAILDVPVETRAEVIAALAAEMRFDAVLLVQSATSVAIAGRLAATLDGGVIWDITDLTLRDGALWSTRLIHGDTTMVQAEWLGGPGIGLVRPGAFEPQERSAVPNLVRIDPIPWIAGRKTLCRLVRAGAPAQDLAKADVIVAGGRGLGTAENLELVRDLAEALGGAAGVSLPLVDMGWAPRSMQVGQTGAVVKPRLYIACGISGQYQHRMGMERSGTIVAINTDRAAPIMAFSDLAVVADASSILPQLTALVRARRG